MNLRFAFTFCALLIGFETAHAQVTNPYFYRISKDGVDSYVLGTIHSGVALNELPENVLDVLHAAKVVVGERAWSLAQAERELDPDAIAREIVAERRSSSAKKMGQTSRQKLLDFGLPRDLVDVLHPYDEFCPFIRGYATKRARQSMDFEIIIQAYHSGQSVEELEDDKLRMQAIDAAGGHVCKIGDLISTEAKTAAVLREESQVMDQQYRTGTLPIYNVNKTELRYRNERWIARIETLHTKSSVFIFVGALHLTEPGNILEMLQARGFTVKKIHARKGPVL